ncbi:hypothetical protein T069G_08780 [Trichoderma breve]|uniref:Uncharacterized protein n=1 Tax=Trichoderma breve TaxID=2034170 RepID=A0A9W9E3Q7_9HYPO|nr:hypothetical protein T069G_08780 [Trichoderma breve]KAJ4857883.1 hypothetical protein T069G_08780 [Trichoderma breve]
MSALAPIHKAWPIYLILSAVYKKLPKRYIKLVKRLYGTSFISDYSNTYYTLLRGLDSASSTSANAANVSQNPFASSGSAVTFTFSSSTKPFASSKDAPTGSTLFSSSKNAVVDQGFLPHYSVTSPANYIAMKSYVDGESLQTFIPATNLRREYLNGVKDLWVRLQRGKNVAPPQLVPISKEDDTVETEDGAPRVGQRFCNASLMWRSLNAPSEFQLKLVYVNALDIPQALMTILEEFAKKFPNDHLTILLTITACFLYKDIINSKDMKLERYHQVAKGAKKTYTQVPLASLAAYILYLRLLRLLRLL